MIRYKKDLMIYLMTRNSDTMSLPGEAAMNVYNAFMNGKAALFEANGITTLIPYHEMAAIGIYEMKTSEQIEDANCPTA